MQFLKSTLVKVKKLKKRQVSLYLPVHLFIPKIKGDSTVSNSLFIKVYRQIKPVSQGWYIYTGWLIMIMIIITGCNGLFYQPTSKNYYLPENLTIKPESVLLKTATGNQISGWYFKTDQPLKKGIFIQFHGNAQNMSSHFFFLYWIINHGYDLFVFDYSGYGLSTGKPTRKNLRQDAIAAFHYINVERRDSQVPIILFAQSLGVAVLTDAFTHFKSKKNIKAVILDSGFYSYQEVARDKLDQFWLFWPFQHLAYLLVSEQHSPENFFQQFSPIPTLVIHGKRDTVVPYYHGEQIFKRLKPPKTFWKIENGKHTSAMRGHSEIYRNKLLSYLDNL